MKQNQTGNNRRGFLKNMLAAMAAALSSYFGASAQRRAPEPVARPVQDEALVREFFDQVFNRGNTQLLERNSVGSQKCADEFHETLVRESAGKQTPDFRQVVANFRNAMPDLHFVIDAITPQGGELLVRWRATGTHRGQLYGWKGTGRRVTIDGTSRVTVEGGNITRMLQTYSASSLRQQLQSRAS